MPTTEDALVRVPADLLAESDDDLLASAAVRQAVLDSFYHDDEAAVT